MAGPHLCALGGLLHNLGHWGFSRGVLTLRALERFGALMTVGLGMDGGHSPTQPVASLGGWPGRELQDKQGQGLWSGPQRV